MTQIKLRRDTAANFTSKNPVLGVGEPAYETDTKKLKIGDGTTAYTQLEYFSAGGGGSADIGAALPLKIVNGVISIEVDGQTIQVVDGKLAASANMVTTNTTQTITGNKTFKYIAINDPYGGKTSIGNGQSKIEMAYDGQISLDSATILADQSQNWRVGRYNKAGLIYSASPLKRVGDGPTFTNYDILDSSNLGSHVDGSTITYADGKLSATYTGFEICDIGMALYVDETKGLRRYLNGQIVDINTNTQAFLNRLKEITTLHPSLLCTEEEWQTAKTMSAFGQVGKFVFNYSGDKIVSVRLPRVVNVQGLFDLQNLGMTVREKLPNITGSFYAATRINDTTGAFARSSRTEGFNGNNNNSGSYNTFNASRSSSTYQDNAPVQQEAVQYPYFIQIATGSETENNIINEIELNNPYSLFDSKYSDHELNNLSWLKSEGQWNAKAVYPTAYDELLKEYNSPDRLATFNKDAFTVVGSPTITDDGVASGFSGSNYIKASITTVSSTSTFEIKIKFKLSGIPNEWTKIWGIGLEGYSQVYITSRNIVFNWAIQGINYDSAIPFSFTGTEDVTYTFGWNGTQIYSRANINGLDYTGSNVSLATSIEFSEIYFANVGSTKETFNGSIDLKNFSITVDGVKVFSGAKSKVKLSTETYTDYDFVLNTADETFRLPLKTKLASGKAVIGNGIALGLTDGTEQGGFGVIYSNNKKCLTMNSASYNTLLPDVQTGTATLKDGQKLGVTTDPTKSGMELSDSGLFLYYYIGETVQNANLIDAGRIGEQLANKIGRTECKAYITETYVNGTSWYRIYSDGWCEQGGYINSGVSIVTNGVVVTFLKPFLDSNYTITMLSSHDDNTTNNVSVQFGNSYYGCYQSSSKTANTIRLCGNGTWHACGYIA